MAIEFLCDAPDCGEIIDEKELVAITTERQGDATQTHLHEACFGEVLKAGDIVEAVLLHD